MRRNKGPVAAGLAVAALLGLGMVGTSIGLVRARQAEAGQAAEARAKEEAAVATAVRDFLTDDLLAQAAPDKNSRDRKVTVEELLRRAAARIEGKFARQPRVEAEIRLTMGVTYGELGDFTAAQPHLERAWEIVRTLLGEDDPGVARFIGNLGVLYVHQGKLAQAEPLLLRMLEISRHGYGEENPLTLDARLALALLYSGRRKFAEAEGLLVQGLEISRRVSGKEHTTTLSFMNNLAQLYSEQGKLESAEPLLTEAIEVSQRINGQEHPDTLVCMSNLALLYQRQRQVPTGRDTRRSGAGRCPPRVRGG